MCSEQLLKSISVQIMWDFCKVMKKYLITKEIWELCLFTIISEPSDFHLLNYCQEMFHLMMIALFCMWYLAITNNFKLWGVNEQEKLRLCPLSRKGPFWCLPPTSSYCSHQSLFRNWWWISPAFVWSFFGRDIGSWSILLLWNRNVTWASRAGA